MIRGLEKIKSKEEYELAKKDLEYCINEYKWISDSKNPKKDIEDELMKCSATLDDIKEKESKSPDEKFESEELAVLSRIQTLKTKYFPVVRGEYKSTLRQNITGLVLMLEEFEASNKAVKFGDIVKGILSGDKDMLDYLKKKYMLSLSNMYGAVPAPENLNLEKVSDILEYMAKNYDLATIDLSDSIKTNGELSMVPIQEPVVGIKADVIRSVNEKTDTYIQVLVSKEEAKTSNKEASISIKESIRVNRTNAHKDISVDKGEIDK